MRLRLRWEWLTDILARRLGHGRAPSSLPPGVKLNLGCGRDYLKGWINVDQDANVGADLVCDFKSIGQHFTTGSVAAIQMIHSISYLRLWEAGDLLREAYNLLKPEGLLILEFPDLDKCARQLRASRGHPAAYLEAVRGIYAFDMDQILRRDLYRPYHFGWSAWHMTTELRNAGFHRIRIMYPQTHDRRIMRDTRIEAVR